MRGGRDEGCGRKGEHKRENERSRGREEGGEGRTMMSEKRDVEDREGLVATNNVENNVCTNVPLVVVPEL